MGVTDTSRRFQVLYEQHHPDMLAYFLRRLILLRRSDRVGHRLNGPLQVRHVVGHGQDSGRTPAIIKPICSLVAVAGSTMPMISPS